MREKVDYFTADYRDGRVHIGGKVYQAGYFATHLLNQFYENDTAARISVFTTDNWHLEQTLEIGYMDKKDFLETGNRMLNIFQALPWLSPFNMLDTKAERERVANLFTEETYAKITEYWKCKAEVYSMTDEQAWLDRVPKSYDKEFMIEARDLLNEVFFTLDFYNDLTEDMQKAFYALRKFVSYIDEAERFDEEHLLPIALEVFGKVSFPVHTEYVGIKKSSRSKTATVARRLYFESYFSFIITDFFEGLHHGHYPRQCEICKKYFLMTSARKQKYCNGISPYVYNGEKTTCRQYAVIMGKKEKVDAHPILSIHKKRCNCIRAELSKGTITREFATAAKEIADELKTLAIHGDNYTAEQFKKDMTREALYALTDKRLKQRQ